MHSEDIDDQGSGDPLRCPVHGTVLSTPDRMHDGPCPQCEAEADAEAEDDGAVGWSEDMYVPQDGDDLPSEEMDGDHESALRDAGFGTDEDYGYFGGDDF